MWGEGAAKRRGFALPPMYQRELSAYPPLSREAEYAVAVQARRGDRAARQKLVRHNLGIVLMVAAKQQLFGVAFDDVVQEGNIGLVRALEKYDPDTGHRFSTYAIWWVRAYVGKYLKEARSAVKPRAGQVAQADLSLHSPIGEEGEAEHLDYVESDAPTPAEAFERARGDHDVRGIVSKIRHRVGALGWDIIENRLMGDEPPTLEEVGQKHGVSRERVRQVEQRTLAVLRSYVPEQLDAVRDPTVRVSIAAAADEREDAPEDADETAPTGSGWAREQITPEMISASSDTALIKRLCEPAPGERVRLEPIVIDEATITASSDAALLERLARYTEFGQQEPEGEPDPAPPAPAPAEPVEQVAPVGATQEEDEDMQKRIPCPECKSTSKHKANCSKPPKEAPAQPRAVRAPEAPPPDVSQEAQPAPGQSTGPIRAKSDLARLTTPQLITLRNWFDEVLAEREKALEAERDQIRAARGAPASVVT